MISPSALSSNLSRVSSGVFFVVPDAGVGSPGFAPCDHISLLCACREVDLGPFKHKIDDGLELRKAAFECMDVLLERCKDRINMGQFITHLEQGLQVPLCTWLLFSWHCRHACLQA